MQQALQGAGLALNKAADSIVSSIVAELVQQCSQVLRQLQGIMVTYRSLSCSPQDICAVMGNATLGVLFSAFLPTALSEAMMPSACPP